MSSPSAFGNVGIIPTLATLRSSTAAGLPPVIFLQGTSTPNDGGQGFYSVNLTDKTTADNGTSVIVDGAGYRWELVTADTANQIVAALSFGGTLPAIDPILGGIATIAAATTTNLATVTQAVVTITGSGVTIASLGTLGAGRLRWVRFADVNTLDYDATALILPGGANITTAAGDAAVFLSLGSGNWQCIDYTEASGGTPGVLPISEGGTGQITAVLAAIALSPKGADIASAATIDLAAATGPVVDITGSTGPVTSLGTVAAGARFLLRFASTPTLTYNATSLILPTGANIVVAAGDVALFTSLGSGNWYCAAYQRATGLPLAVIPIALGGTNAITPIGAYINLSPASGAIASAATIDLATATGPDVSITGNTGPVTSLGTVAAGAEFTLRFASTPTLTYNAVSLILPTAANIVAAAGDVAKFVSLGAGNWVCTSYQRASGLPLAVVPITLGGTGQATAQLACQALGTWWKAGGNSGGVVTRNSVNGAGDAVEEAAATIPIPAAAPGPNGVIKVTAFFTQTNSANAKTWRVRFGASGAGVAGTQFYAVAATNQLIGQIQIIIWNNNSAAAQASWSAANAVPFGQTTNAGTTGVINTAAASEVVISTVWAGATSGESMTLTSYTVEVLYGA